MGVYWHLPADRLAQVLETHLKTVRNAPARIRISVVQSANLLHDLHIQVLANSKSLDGFGHQLEEAFGVLHTEYAGLPDTMMASVLRSGHTKTSILIAHVQEAEVQQIRRHIAHLGTE